MAIAGLNVLDMLRDQLNLKQLEIDTLLQITKSINENEPASRLFQLFEKTLRDQLGVERFILYISSNGWQINLFSDKNDAVKRISVEKDLLPFNKLTFLDELNGEKPDYLEPYDILIPVFHKEHPLAYLLISNPKVESYEPLEDKIKFTQTITNILTVAIENKRLFKKEIEQKAFEKELEVAAQMQSMLIPDKLPKNKYVEMAAIYLPHQNIGGDYYDYMPLNEEEFFFCVADISGKGIPAALLMANFQAQLRELVKKNHATIDEFLQELNQGVLHSTRGEKFITMFLGKYNLKTRLLKYVNAGHNPPMLITSKGKKLLDTGCTILGMFEKLPAVKLGQIPVVDDTTIIAYTDGLTDLVNEKEEAFSLEVLSNFAQENYTSEVEVLNKKLLTDITRFKEGRSFTDDITVLTVKLFGK
ncbi:MAG: GAF domain-containing SpoIIE family protein phosphatase [Chitinophagales bacterium]